MISLLFALSLAAEPELPEPVSEPVEAGAPEGPDRSTPPTVVPATPRELPELVWTELGPTAQLGFVPVAGARKVELVLRLERGSVELGGDEATSDGLGWLMDAATTSFKPDEFEVMQDLEDIQVTSDIGSHSLSISVTAPREKLALALEWMGAVLHTPAFPGADLKRWKQEQALWYQLEAPNRAGTVGRYALSQAWYPADHPYGSRPSLDAFGKVSSRDLRSRHERLLDLAPITILAAGDVDGEALASQLASLIDGVGAPGKQAADLAVAPGITQTVIAVDMPSQEQVTILARYAAPAQDHADNPGFVATDFAMGGTFLSRLNSNLREENGFTYGAGSFYGYDLADGSWTLSVDVRGEVVEQAVREIIHEIDEIAADGVTSTEIDALYRDRVASWNDTMRNATSAVGFYQGLYSGRLSVAEARKRIERLAQITPDETREVAARWLGKDAGRVWVFVGSRANLEPAFEALHLDAVWLTPDQAVMGTFDDPLTRETTP